MVASQSTAGRKLLQIGYYWYGDTNHRWLYWAIPLIAVGVAVFVFAIVLFLYRRRRAYRRHSSIPLTQQPQPVYGTPVTGWPDYNSQYQNDYSNFSSNPTAPGSSQGQYGKASGVEMGVPPPGYPVHQQNMPHY